jgi:hypothetical protein
MGNLEYVCYSSGGALMYPCWRSVFLLLLLFMCIAPVSSATAQSSVSASGSDSTPSVVMRRFVSRSGLGHSSTGAVLDRPKSFLPDSVAPLATSTVAGFTPNFGGFYAAPLLIPGPTDTVATVTGDFNDDGKPDVVNVGLQGELAILLNNGSGSFAAPITSKLGSVPAVGPSLAIVTALATDLNGDGYTDLVLSTRLLNGSSFLLVLLNRRDGTFGPPAALSIPGSMQGTASQGVSLAVGQTTASGYVDIVAATFTNLTGRSQIQMQTFLNNGSGVFTPKPAQIITLPAGQQALSYSSTVPVLSDVNHDGHLDLLLERYAPPTAAYVDLLLGNGDGTFQQPTPSSPVVFPGVENFYFDGLASLTTASLTGDASKSDLILTTESGVYIALSNGNGTFQSPTLVPATGGITQLLVTDINGDGKPDLIASGFGTLITYVGKGDGTFSVSGTAVAFGEPSIGFAQHTVAADFNDDGKIDFVSGDSSGNVEVALGAGDGTFVATPILYSATSPVLIPSSFAIQSVGDLNGDGLTDLIGIGSDFIYSGIADGNGGFRYTIALPATAYNEVYIPSSTADFNHDGKQDAIFVGFDGTAAVALSNGDGTFKTPLAVIQPPNTLACYPSYSATGDINGDGNLDVVFAYSGDAACSNRTNVSAGYLTALGNGDGTFKAATFTSIGNSLYSVALARFHGKNQPLDLVINDTANPAQNATVSILQGKGDGTFGAPVLIHSGDRITQMLTDDFDQDGLADLTLVAQAGTESSSDGSILYASNGDGTFGAPSAVGGTAINLSAVYADVNGDGIPDLIGGGSHGILSVNLGAGKGAFATPISYFYQDNNGPIFAGKFFGDNTLSLVAFNEYGGGTAFFINQGGTSFTIKPSSTKIMSGASIFIASTLASTRSGQPTPTGTITYYDGGISVGNGSVGGSFSLPLLTIGTHSITAEYSGDAHFNPNNSAAVAINVAAAPAPDFTFSASVPALTLPKGQSGTVILTLAANATLNSTYSFQCTGLPAESTCTFQPASLTVASGSSGQTTLTISTKAATVSAGLKEPNVNYLEISRIFTFAALFLFVVPRRHRRHLTILLVLTCGGLFSLGGCSGGSTKATSTPVITDPGTATGTTNIVITATGSGAAAAHTLAIALTVQ